MLSSLFNVHWIKSHSYDDDIERKDLELVKAWYRMATTVDIDGAIKRSEKRIPRNSHVSEFLKNMWQDKIDKSVKRAKPPTRRL